MAQARKKINGGKPLSALDIKHILLDRKWSIVGLAKEATIDLERDVTAWQLKAVIYRYPGVVYQDLRAWLARRIGCHVSQVGREPLARKVIEPAPETRAA